MTSALDLVFGDTYEDAPIGEGFAPFFTPGTFYLKVIELKVGVSEQKGFPFFVAEFEVLKSDVADFKPGSRVQWMVARKEARYNKMYDSNIKNCLWGIIQGEDSSDSAKAKTMTRKLGAAAVSQGQPFTNFFVKAIAHNNAKDFTVVNFHGWDGELPNEVEVA